MSDEFTNDEQELVHDAIKDIVADRIEENAILTGWVLVYETRLPDQRSSISHLYGPSTMTDWHASGLVDWAKRYTIPAPEDDD